MKLCFFHFHNNSAPATAETVSATAMAAMMGRDRMAIMAAIAAPADTVQGQQQGGQRWQWL